METKQPPPDMDIEKTFNEFVEDFGGELVSKIFQGRGTRPDNADYFFYKRTMVAELKCLKKNYFNDKEVGEKLTVLMNRWWKEGLLRQEHIQGGRFQTDNLPRQCALEVDKVFGISIKKAVEKANKQIKETKKYFGIPNAKGLLIIANDGNYSIDLEFIRHILGNILQSMYTSIDSYIFFTPNMRAYTSQIDTQFHIWVSGRCRPSSNAVERDLLDEIQQGWTFFLERKTGETVTQFHIQDRNTMDTIKWVR